MTIVDKVALEVSVTQKKKNQSLNSCAHMALGVANRWGLSRSHKNLPISTRSSLRLNLRKLRWSKGEKKKIFFWHYICGLACLDPGSSFHCFYS